MNNTLIQFRMFLRFIFRLLHGLDVIPFLAISLRHTYLPLTNIDLRYNERCFKNNITCQSIENRSLHILMKTFVCR